MFDQFAIMALQAIGNDPDPTTLTYVTDQIDDVVKAFIDVMESLVINPFFAFLFAAGFVRILMSLIKKAKKTSR